VRPAGVLFRRSSYATSAVGATILALIALLGVSVAVARQGGGQGRGEQLAGESAVATPASNARDVPGSGGGRGAANGRRATDAAGAAGASSDGNGSDAPKTGVGGSGVSGGAGSGGAAGSGGGSGSGGAGVGAAGGGASGRSGDGSGGNGASGQGSVPASSDGPATTMAVHPAKAGNWPMQVEARADGTLFPADSGDAHLVAGEAAADGTQRFDPQDGPTLGTVAGYTSRVVHDGRYLTELELRGQPGRRFVAAVPVLDVPSTWRPGDRWSWRLTAEDGKTTIDATSTVVGRETATLADGRTQVDAVRIDATIVLSGDRSITVTRKLWFAPSLGVPVRTEEHSSGTDQTGRSVTRDATIQLAATEPGTTSSSGDGGVVPASP
jgi:hypothetical protein